MTERVPMVNTLLPLYTLHMDVLSALFVHCLWRRFCMQVEIIGNSRTKLCYVGQFAHVTQHMLNGWHRLTLEVTNESVSVYGTCQMSDWNASV